MEEEIYTFHSTILSGFIRNSLCNMDLWSITGLKIIIFPFSAFLWDCFSTYPIVSVVLHYLVKSSDIEQLFAGFDLQH